MDGATHLGLRPFQKHAFFTLSHGDLYESIEEVHIIFIAWILHSNPWRISTQAKDIVDVRLSQTYPC
jgi:hypothetical protein